MALYLETSKGFVPWTGQKIDGMSHPRNIERVWSKEELAEHRLFVPVEPAVPEGKVVTGRTVGREGGTVTYIYQLEDEPPPPPPRRDLAAEIDALKARVTALEASPTPRV